MLLGQPIRHSIPELRYFPLEHVYQLHGRLISTQCRQEIFNFAFAAGNKKDFINVEVYM